MFIVLSSEKELPKEVELIQTLLEQGLQSFHLRKPYSKKSYLNTLLEKLPQSLHRHIVLHQHHELAREFNIGGIHFKERERKTLENNKQLLQEIELWKKKRLSVSTSMHSIENVFKYGTLFDYVFLSPVFDSISKKEYMGKQFSIPHTKAIVIGLGGINANNMQQAFDLGYDGVAMLGSIWEGESLSDNFQLLATNYQKIWEK